MDSETIVTFYRGCTERFGVSRESRLQSCRMDGACGKASALSPRVISVAFYLSFLGSAGLAPTKPNYM